VGRCSTASSGFGLRSSIFCGNLRRLILLLRAGRLCSLDRRHDLLALGRTMDGELDITRAGGVLQLKKLLRTGGAGIGQRRKMARGWDQLKHQLLPFAVQLGCQDADPRNIAAGMR
jgi:hypothetical protein